MSRVFIEPAPDGGYQINNADGSPPHRGFTTQEDAVGTARLYGDDPLARSDADSSPTASPDSAGAA